MIKRLLTFVVSGALAMSVASCGGSTNGGQQATSTQPPSTSPGTVPGTAPGTSTTTSAPSADAERAAITAADLGEPWVESVKAVGIQVPSETSCSRTSGNALEGLAQDGRYVGAVYQRAPATIYARTTTFLFRDDAAALAFVDMLRAESYQKCRVEGLSEEEAAQPGAPAGASWRLSQIGDPEHKGEGGFELQLTYQFRAEVNGTIQDGNGLKEEVILRKGPVVAIGLYEFLAKEGDPPELQKQSFEETVAAMRTANGRV